MDERQRITASLLISLLLIICNVLYICNMFVMWNTLTSDAVVGVFGMYIIISGFEVLLLIYINDSVLKLK